MTNIEHFLIGTYQVQGSKLLKGSICLLINKRKKTTSKKTSQYLLRLDKKPAKYISSIYPLGAGAYKFDYNNIDFVLTIKTDKAIIEQGGGNA